MTQRRFAYFLKRIAAGLPKALDMENGLILRLENKMEAMNKQGISERVAIKNIQIEITYEVEEADNDKEKALL